MRRVPDGDITLPASRMQQGQIRYLGVAGEWLVALSWDGAIGGLGGSARDCAKNALQVWDLASRSVRARVDAVEEPSPGDMEVGGLTVHRAAAATLISASNAGDRVVAIDLSGRVALRRIHDLWRSGASRSTAPTRSRCRATGAGCWSATTGAPCTSSTPPTAAPCGASRTGHGDVTTVAISDDGAYVASAGYEDDAAEVRDAATRAVVARIDCRWPR